MFVNRYGALLYLDESDAKDGKLIVPKEVKSIGVGSFDLGGYEENIKVIEFEEGLENVGDNAFEYLTNLERVEFPSTLKTLGKSLFFRNKTVQYTLKSYPKISINTFGFEETSKYIREIILKSDKLLDSNNLNDIEEAIACYDSVINQMGDGYGTEIEELYNKITYKILEKLSQKQNGKEIGEILISKRLKENTEITEALLLYDAYKVHKELGIKFIPVKFEKCITRAIMSPEGEMTVGMDELKQLCRDESGKLNVKEFNLLVLRTIRHETFHWFQRNSQVDSVEKLDMMIQEAEYYHPLTGFSGHIAKHSFMPSEIGADVFAYNCLKRDLIEKFDYDEKEATEYIDLKLKSRMQIVYDKYGIGPDDDYRRVIMEEALDSGRLTEYEYSKLLQIYQTYMDLHTEHNL